MDDTESEPARRNNPNEPTTAENRTANTKAKRKRDKWRAEYALVCEAIRFLKNEVRQYPSRSAQIMLRSMQQTARESMVKREAIGIALKSTAYPYV